MSDNNFSNSINKGVPVSAPINLKYYDLMNLADDKEKMREILDGNFKELFVFLQKYDYKGMIEYLYTTSVDIDPDTLKKQVYMSLSGYFSTLAINLGCVDIKENPNDALVSYDGISDEWIEKFVSRLAFLREQNNLQKFKINFPFLYAKYQNIEKSAINARKNLIYLSKLNKLQRDIFLDDLKSKYPGVNHLEDLKEISTMNLSKFVEACAKDLEILIDNFDEIFQYMKDHPIDFSGLGEIDYNKLELYIVNCYLNMADMVSDEFKQSYLYYVSSYFYEHKDLLNSDINFDVNKMKGSKYSYLFKIDEEVISPQSLYKRYCGILAQNPKLRDINFASNDFTGMSLDEINEFMEEYIKDLSAQWEFLPDDDKKYDEVIIDKIKNVGKGMSDTERKDRQESLLRLFMEKKELYDSSDPYKRIMGKDTFDGYIGYIYSNGRVILDKLYDNALTGRLANGSAIYAMNINDFYELSKLSKSEIIKNNLCRRYVHRGDWVKRIIENEINVDRENNPSSIVNGLIDNGEIINSPGGKR